MKRRSTIATVAALSALFLLPAAGTSVEQAPGTTGGASGPAERLETSFAALQTVLDRPGYPPTVRDLFRRMTYLRNHGQDPVYPGIQWSRTRHQANIALESVEFNACVECALLVTLGKNSRDHTLRSPIRKGAFFVGIDQAGTVLCVGPSEPEALSCDRAPQGFPGTPE